GDEAARLARAQDHALGQIAFQRREHVVELDEYILGEDVGAAATLVAQHARNAVIIAREPPVAPVALPARRSRERTELQVARRQNVPDLTHETPQPRLDPHTA